MCMEDIRIWRRTQQIERPFTIGTTASQVLGYAPRRVAIIFCSSTAGRVTFGQTSGVLDQQGIMLNLGQVPLICTLEDLGSFVQQPWWAIAQAAGSKCAVYEVLLPED